MSLTTSKDDLHNEIVALGFPDPPSHWRAIPYNTRSNDSVIGKPMSGASRVGWRGLSTTKSCIGKNLAPIQRISDLTDAFLPGGMMDTIFGSKIPSSAQHGPIYPNLQIQLTCFLR